MKAEVLAASKAAQGNGKHQMGFVTSTDPGLKPNEYIVVPPSFKFDKPSKTTAAGYADQDAAATTYAAVCVYDGRRVAEFTRVPEVLKPFVLANRANTIVRGKASKNEVEISSAGLSDAAVDKAIADYPWIMDAIRMNVQHGTYAIYTTAVMYYTTNHNIGGKLLPKGMTKPVRTFLNLPDTVTAAQISDAVYLAGHASDKRITLKDILPEAGGDALLEVMASGVPIDMQLDSWAGRRVGSDMLPANVHVLGVLKVLLTKVASYGLIGFQPAPSALAALKAAYTKLGTAPWVFHPGAQYLFGEDCVTMAETEDLKVFVGIFADWAMAATVCQSVTAPEHIVRLAGEHSIAAWRAAGKSLAKGVEMDQDTLKAAMSAVGATTGDGIPSPKDDAAGYKTAAEKMTADLASLKI